jgi:hypothetical protein
MFALLPLDRPSPTTTSETGSISDQNLVKQTQPPCSCKPRVASFVDLAVDLKVAQPCYWSLVKRLTVRLSTTAMSREDETRTMACRATSMPRRASQSSHYRVSLVANPQV